ncbi:hypothetical protein ACFSJ3_03270 [Corallincola platygyrae]|uniref:Uncharacterized protein n=1 Tax=Corallincola platygyrae TaxID=1193278 RepID=A0ABW4XIW1_9GAMM
MNTGLIVFVGIVFVVWIIWGDSLPKKYRIRSCEGKAWKKRFPEAPKTEIRDFLPFFMLAFAFNDSNRLKFNPDDKLLDIYRNLYPHKWQADAMEFENLDGDLRDKYGISLESVWHDDLTLGELFEKVKTA